MNGLKNLDINACYVVRLLYFTTQFFFAEKTYNSDYLEISC